MSGSRKPGGGGSSYSSSSSSEQSGKGGRGRGDGLNGDKWEDLLKNEAFRKMSLAELKAATRNFDKDNLLGSGGFGDVFRGTGPKGQPWAVKRARPGAVQGGGSSQGQRDFEREVVTMSQLSHKHLVRLLGYCTDKGEHIVVYELMQGGSLAAALHGIHQQRGSPEEADSTTPRSTHRVTRGMSDHSETTAHNSGRSLGTSEDKFGRPMSMSRLTGKLSGALGSMLGGSTGRVCNGTAPAGLEVGARGSAGEVEAPLSFLQRIDIATGTAEALHYLHSALAAPVVHRDIKPDNILLDSKMRAKVADFGLVKLMREAAGRQPGLAAESTRVTGTRGYLDPDYWEEGRASPAVDVYSFGVVVLELLTGRKPLVSRPGDLAAMYGASPGKPADAESAGSGLSGLDLTRSSAGSRWSGRFVDEEAAVGQQVLLRDWVDQVLRSSNRLHSVLDPGMDLDLGTSSRARRGRHGPDEQDPEAQPSVEEEEVLRARKREAVDKAIKAFLHLGRRCTGKTAQRPLMAEVATQLQQIRRELRAARENQFPDLSPR